MPEALIRRSPKRLASASRLLEAASLAADDAATAAARQRWAALAFGRQLQLAQVLAECRRAEFTQRYRSVVQVAGGLKRRRDDAGNEFLHRQACVIFVVRRKSGGSHRPLPAGQRLPGELLTPAWIDGCDQIVAIPTDVQPQKYVLGASAQSASAVHTQPVGEAGDEGSLACALASGGSARFALAPIHVFSPFPVDGQGPAAGAAVLRLVNPKAPFDDRPVLVTTGFGGRLARAPVRSFDAQFAEVRDRSKMAAALAGLKLSVQRPCVRNIAELGACLADGRLLQIQVPSNHLKRRVADQPPLLAALSMTEADHLLDYLFHDGGRGSVLHNTLQLQIQSGEATLPGDSGCPVIVANDGDKPSLVGMHIAGNPETGISFVIPAWRLLAAGSYLQVGGSVPDAGWQLMASL